MLHKDIPKYNCYIFHCLIQSTVCKYANNVRYYTPLYTIAIYYYYYITYHLIIVTGILFEIVIFPICK